MDWNLFWTIIWQIVLASMILALPLGFLVFTVASAIEAGSRRVSTSRAEKKIL